MDIAGISYLYNWASKQVRQVGEANSKGSKYDNLQNKYKENCLDTRKLSSFKANPMIRQERLIRNQSTILVNYQAGCRFLLEESKLIFIFWHLLNVIGIPLSR